MELSEAVGSRKFVHLRREWNGRPINQTEEVRARIGASRGGEGKTTQSGGEQSGGALHPGISRGREKFSSGFM